MNEAIEEVKAMLVEGSTLADAVAEVAPEFDVKPLALTNRVLTAIGSVESYVATTKVLRTVSADAQRRMDLSANKAALASLGPVKAGTAEADKLVALVRANRELGGSAYIKNVRRRAR